MNAVRRGVRFGIVVLPLPYLGARSGEDRHDELVRMAEMADSLGYDSVWTSDSVARSFPRFDTFCFLMALAVKTRKVKLGTLVLATPLRHPILLARMIGTIDVFSDGRFVLGAGLGWLPEEFRNLGIPKSERAGRTEETILILKELWARDQVDFHGRYFDLRQVTVNPKPVQKPHPAILFGGESEKALRRVARLGSGWLPGSGTTPEKIRRGLECLGEIFVKEGLPAREVSTVVQLDLHLASTREIALQKGEQWYLQFQGQIIQNKPFEMIVDGGAFGPAEECVEKIAAYAEAGAEAMILRFFATDWLAQFELFRERVFPVFASQG